MADIGLLLEVRQADGDLVETSVVPDQDSPARVPANGDLQRVCGKEITMNDGMQEYHEEVMEAVKVYGRVLVGQERSQDKQMWEPAVAAAESGIEAAGDPSSGFLHVIVGDMNVDDFQFDLTRTDYDLKKAYDEAEPWERGIFDALAELTEEERATAVAMEWGYIAEDGTLREDLR